MFGIDGDEDSAAAGEDFVLVVQDFGGVDVGSSADFDLAAFDAQGLVQGDRLEVFDRHLPGKRDDMVQLVHLTHGVVEDAGDDAAVAVARWTDVTIAQAEAADEGLAGFVEDELEAHAFPVVRAADEAVVFMHLDEAGVVALRLRWHGIDFNLRFSGTLDRRSSKELEGRGWR